MDSGRSPRYPAPMEAGTWICTDGHVKHSNFANPHLKWDLKGQFCSECSAALVMGCGKCGCPFEPIFNRHVLPRFCRACAQPYPWVESRLAAAAEVLRETQLGDEEQEQVLTDVRDVVRDAPRAAAAGMRFRRIMDKIGGVEILRGIVTDILSDAGRRILFGA